MKLFLTVALSLTVLALIAHAQSLPPGYGPPPPGYPPPPPGYYPPPPGYAPPAYAPAPTYAPPPATTEMIPPPPSQPPQSFSQQTIPPGMPPMTNAGPPAPSALQAQQQGNITFVSGGAGEEDRAALQQVESQYNLRLMFAARSGDFLANVAVTLADARGGTVLDTIANGPIFYARVPPGRYRLTVTNQGQSQSRDISVGAAGAVRQDFYWATAS